MISKKEGQHLRPMISKIWEKLKDPAYRKAYVASQINIGIPFQIRALLKSRPGWTQQTLAERASMLQPRISGLMTPGKVRPNIETLRRIAEAFDCALVVRFAPFSDLVRWSEDFDPENFNAPPFAEDRLDASDANLKYEQIPNPATVLDSVRHYFGRTNMGLYNPYERLNSSAPIQNSLNLCEEHHRVAPMGQVSVEESQLKPDEFGQKLESIDEMKTRDQLRKRALGEAGNGIYRPQREVVNG